MKAVTSQRLDWQAQDFDFELLDVRRAGVRAEQGAQIAGAHGHNPAAEHGQGYERM